MFSDTLITSNITQGTDISIANYYLSDIAEKSEMANQTFSTISILLVFLLVAVCFSCGIQLSKAFKRS